MSIYILIANIVKGNNMFTSKKRGHTMIIIQSVVAGIIVSIITTIQNYMSYGDKMQENIITNLILVALVTFISSATFTLIVLELFHLANNKKQQAINSELDSGE